MSTDQPDKPKIIVDDDWKERVQAEKESLRKGGEKQREKQASPPPLPSASFPLLVTSLATQAWAELGQIPDPSGKAVVRLDHAKHVIDTLGMLDDKTKGNLTREESTMLTEILHELRMAFVTISQSPPSPDVAREPKAP